MCIRGKHKNGERLRKSRKNALMSEAKPENLKREFKKAFDVVCNLSSLRNAGIYVTF